MSPDAAVGWFLVGASLAILGATVILLARGPREHNCPGCDFARAFEVEGSEAFAAHTAAALRVVAGSNVVPMQRRASRWS